MWARNHTHILTHSHTQRDTEAEAERGRVREREREREREWERENKNVKLGGGEARVLEGFGEDKEDDKTYYDNFLKSQQNPSFIPCYLTGPLHTPVYCSATRQLLQGEH